MRHLLVFSLLLATRGMVWAQANDCASLTHQALDISGVNQSLNDAAEMASSDTFMSQVSGSDGRAGQIAATLKPIVMKHLNGDLLRGKVESRMAYDCNPQQMTSVIQELQSPLVARMLALEAAAITPEGRAKSQRYAKAISIAPPPDERVDAIEAIDASAGGTDYTVDTAIAVTRGMMAGADMDPGIATDLQQHRRQVAAQMHKAVQISMLSTYRTAPVPDLQQYAKELSSEPLKGFYERVKRICLQVFEEQARAMGHDMKAALNAQLASHEKNP
jgi:hypothetical protein